jgi:hypothetical protein
MPDEKHRPPEDAKRSSEAAHEASPHVTGGGGNRLRDIARRLIPADGGDVKDALVAVLATGDKAKTEMVRMVAREVRTYLDELKIKEDLQELATNYSLEVHASVSLKPLAGGAKKRTAKKKTTPKR